MTRLLVSVRDVAEAEAALRGGADLIDVKEPNHGALGAAALEVVQAVFDAVDGRVPVSAACGELLGASHFSFGRLPSLAFAKLGLAGCGSDAEWQDKFDAIWKIFSPEIGRVAVAYADWLQCDGISPNAVIEVGAKNRCGHLLFDTTDKTNCLFDYVSHAQLHGWTKLAAAHGMQLVIAGSVSLNQLELIVESWNPAFIAVRGAACEAGRESKVSEHRVAELSQKLLELSPRNSGIS